MYNNKRDLVFTITICEENWQIFNVFLPRSSVLSCQDFFLFLSANLIRVKTTCSIAQVAPEPLLTT